MQLATATNKRLKKDTPKGLILYRGPSLWDDKPIVVIANKLAQGSDNRKTGELIQVWILSDNGEKPSDALYKSGLSRSVCGDCPNDALGTCYVNVGQAPNSVYRAYLSGSYVDYDAQQHSDLFEGRLIRLGAYGDPATVPISVWDAIVPLCAGNTGYTHQWRKEYAQDYKRYCMASADSQLDYIEAKRLGWRTFRVCASDDDSANKREVVCPAAEESTAATKKTCEECLMCNGLGSAKAPDVRIKVHGLDWKTKRFNQAMPCIAKRDSAALAKLTPLTMSARPYPKTDAKRTDLASRQVAQRLIDWAPNREDI